MSLARAISMFFHCGILLVTVFTVLSNLSLAQQPSPTPNLAQPEDKRIFWIIPNYRTSPSLHPYKPLTPEEKFKIATEDSFDRGTAALAVLFAGEAQLTNANPVVLHQDPRYFRRGTGSTWARLGSAASQIFWTHTDSDHTQFNFSEVIGNSTAVAISTAYYPDNRTATNAVSKLGVQLGVDMASNILKEFWPDINRKFSREHRPGR